MFEIRFGQDSKSIRDFMSHGEHGFFLISIIKINDSHCVNLDNVTIVSELRDVVSFILLIVAQIDIWSLIEIHASDQRRNPRPIIYPSNRRLYSCSQ